MSNLLANALTPWSEEDVAMLRKLMADGLSQRAIAAALGRSRGGIATKLRAERKLRPIPKRNRGPKDAAEWLPSRPFSMNDKPHVHLRGVLLAGGYSWWSDEALVRLYALERSLPGRRAA